MSRHNTTPHDTLTPADQFGRRRHISPTLAVDLAQTFTLPPDLDPLTAAHLRMLVQYAARLTLAGHGDLAADAATFGVRGATPGMAVAQ